jgi:tetratricopeptide (TPR) repeat protein
MTRIWRALVVLLLLTRTAGAQQAAGVSEALARRDRGDLPGAIGILRARVQEAPDDATARRLLAQTLYWNQEFAAAREHYERGVALHAGDHQLRIEYARMLVETGDAPRARSVLEPVLASPRAAAAHTLLGTLEYWRGDWTRASRHFRAAIAADSMASDARQRLSEIESATTPWIRAALEYTSDNQPLRAMSPVAETGAYLTPLWSAGVRVRATANSNVVAGSGTWQQLEAFSAGTLVPGRLRLETAVGGARRGDASRLMGQADLALVVRHPV